MRFRGGLVFKAHRLLHHSTLGLRVIKKKKKDVVSGAAVQRITKLPVKARTKLPVKARFWR